MITFGLGVGPLLGGFFTEVFTWRLIFATDVFLLLVSLGLAWRLLSLGIVTPQEEKRESVDYARRALVTITLASLVYAVSHGKTSGMDLSDDPGGLCSRPCRRSDLLRPRTPDQKSTRAFRTFRVSTLYRRDHRHVRRRIHAFRLLFLLESLLQSPSSLHLTAISAGLAVLPIAVPMLLISVFVPKRLEREHFRWAIATGMLALAIGFGLMSLSTNQTTYADIWWKLAILGCGFGLTFPLVPTVGLRDLADHHAGQGAGVINTCLFIGAIVGVVVGGLITANVAHEFVAEPYRPCPTNQMWALRLSTSSRMDQRVTKGRLGELSAGDAERLKATLADLEDDTFDAVMISLAVMAVIGMLTSILLMRDRPIGPIA